MPASFTVKATQGGNTATGMSMVLKVITGAALAQPGVTGTQQFTSANPDISVTPAGSGSTVYGALLCSGTGAVTANGSTTFLQTTSGSGLRYVQFSGPSTTASSAQDLGTTGATTGLDIAVAEILAGPGLTLAEDASSPAVTAFSATFNITTASFTPPRGSLLVLMVSSNGSAGTTTMAITDTSGQNLTWAEQAKANGNSKGYAGVWSAQMPAPGGFFGFFR